MDENQENVQPNEQKKFNICALLSFILSLVGLIVAALPCGIASVILGIVGLVTFKPETQKGRWMAIAGLCIGLVDVAAALLYAGMIAQNILS